MTNLIVVVFLILLACFSFVLLFGAPFLPTLKSQSQTLLDLTGLKAGQRLLDLGCGDGRVLIKAAQKGVIGYGYELNPILFLIAKYRTRHYRQLIKISWGNYWRAEWPEVDVIYIFLLDKFMSKLEFRLINNKQPIKVVSNAFRFSDRLPEVEKNGLFLYVFKV